MKINLSSPDICQADIDAVVEVLKTPSLSLGPRLPEFEQAFCRYIGRKHAVAVNSGTGALQLALIARGIGPGDEVITTPYSFIATTNVILMVGAKPVFADIDPVTYNIDIRQVEKKITPKTRAIIPVEVFGNPAGIDKIYDLALRKNLFCLEDSCEALGSIVNGRKVGTLGHVSTFAFYPNKQMTTGEGGILLTDDKTIADLCMSLRSQGRDLGPGWLSHVRLGYNYRLSDINCALGISQLKRIDQFIAKRSQVAQWYSEILSGESRVISPRVPEGCLQSWFVYVIRLQDQYTQAHRDQVLTELRDRGIGCSNYFPPIHLQPHIVKALGAQEGDFPVTEAVSRRTFALPFHNNITRQEVQTVCDELRQILDHLKP